MSCYMNLNGEYKKHVRRKRRDSERISSQNGIDQVEFELRANEQVSENIAFFDKT